MEYKTILFTRLLEKVIKTNVIFVESALENAKKKIQKVSDPDDDFVAKVLDSEFKRYKGEQFDEIRFSLSKSGPSNTERHKAVYIIQGIGSNNGIIRIIYASGLHKVFAKDFKYWKVFKDLVSEIISHEIVHIIQFDKIMNKYKDNPKKYVKVIQSLGQEGIETHKEYLSQKMEIMAFARNAVEEFRSHGFSNEDIVKYIKNFSKADIDDSFVFYVYQHFFDKNDKILKKFLKNVYSYVK